MHKVIVLPWIYVVYRCIMFAEDFVTPSSTPPNEAAEEETKDVQQENSKTSTNVTDLFSELSEAALHDKIYDQYVFPFKKKTKSKSRSVPDGASGGVYLSWYV